MIATVAAAYYITGRLGLALAIPPGYATAVWPPSGIALAAVLLAGGRVWPGVLLGSFLVNISTGFDAGTTVTLFRSMGIPAAIAGGAALQAVGGGFLIRRFGGFPNPLRTVPQIIALLGLGGGTGCLINATIGASCLFIAGRVPLASVPFTWLTWWGGDTIGVFVFTPMALALLMRPRTEWKRRSAIVVIATAATFTAGVSLVAFTSDLERKDFNSRLAEKGEDLASAVEMTIAARMHAVDAMKAFLSHSDEITPEEFIRFSTTLRSNISGVLALEWIPRVTSDHRSAFEARVRDQGVADFHITEASPQGLVPAGFRSEYFPVTYVEPIGDNKRAVGFDLASHDERRATLDRARASGALAVTGRITLVQGGDGVLAVVPAHRAVDGRGQREDYFAGFALGVIRLADLAQTAFRGRDTSDLLYWLVDQVDQNSPVILLANTDQAPSAFNMIERGLFGGRAAIEYEHQFDVGGRLWILRVAPTQVFLANHRAKNSLFVLLGGLLAAGLVGAFALVVTGREGELQGLVDARTTALQQALDQLACSEERFRSLVEGTTDWVWETDAEHRFVWFSSSYEQVVGRSAATVLGKRRWDVASHDHDIDATLWQAHIEEMTAHRPFRDFRYWIALADGQAKWISVSGSPRFDDDGNFVGYRGSGSDITADASGAMRIKMLSTVVEQSPVSVVITDPDGLIQYVNAHLISATGYEPAEVIGENSRIFASGETPAEVYQDMWATIMAGRQWVGELHNRRKDGVLRWEEVIIAPVMNDEGKASHYVGIKVDITEAKSLQDKLRQTNAELEQFAYVTSHDLRQPLRMVSSYLSLIEKRLGPDLDDTLKEFLDFAVGGAKRMDHLILGLLEYSRTGKTAEMEPVPLGGAIADALDNLSVAIKEAAGEVAIGDTLPTVLGDPMELTRLFQNLIGNAVKYRAPDRPPRVTVSCRRQGREWLVSVKDNGIGIAPEDRERAFAIFQRLVAQDAYEGTGIGLAVCKKIVEHHGGRIWIESTPGEGSTFFVAFPVTETRTVQRE